MEVITVHCLPLMYLFFSLFLNWTIQLLVGITLQMEMHEKWGIVMYDCLPQTLENNWVTKQQFLCITESTKEIKRTNKITIKSETTFTSSSKAYSTVIFPSVSVFFFFPLLAKISFQEPHTFYKFQTKEKNICATCKK